MKIIICCKQVPDTSGKVAVKPDGTLDRSSMPTVINPDDLNACEAALKLKDDAEAKGVKVETICVTMGPPQATIMLHEMLAMGVDRGVLISAREFGGSDTFATSQIIAAALKKIGIEKDTVVFCGRQAIDGDTAQVGPQIAEELGLPQVSYAADIKKNGNTLTVRRMLEDGYMTLEVQTPCLITCIKELNTPRYMSVKGINESDKKPFEIFDYNALKDDPLIEKDTIGLKGSPTNIFKSFTPPQKGAGMMIPGADKDTVTKLFGILTEKHIGGF
jgi:electron transfer flavoprotein beta subunit